MDKQFLVEQLAAKLRESLAVARQAEKDASDEARDGATASEKRENARVAQEYSSLARGQAQRAGKLVAELNALLAFRPGPLPPRSPIVLGAVVEVEDEATGRTFFLAPAGAGLELSGPGGDGFLSVVTPASPVGRAVLGRRVGDTVEITVEGEPREWTITYAA
ncbi:MAG TPA: GreA/GreB family elongation factor [Pseudomonadota bacterium]|nr:GreA/GreB family elongation factor [Pseudomonadota bacterium]